MTVKETATKYLKKMKLMRESKNEPRIYVRIKREVVYQWTRFKDFVASKVGAFQQYMKDNQWVGYLLIIVLLLGLCLGMWQFHIVTLAKAIIAFVIMSPVVSLTAYWFYGADPKDIGAEVAKIYREQGKKVKYVEVRRFGRWYRINPIYHTEAL